MLKSLIDLVFTPTCLACGARIYEAADLLCLTCQRLIASPVEEVCPLCGGMVEDSTCLHCEQSDYTFDLARSALLFRSPVQDLIHEFKYNYYQCVSPWLVAFMAQAFHQEPGFQKCNVITPVPLHRVRKRERGFNQSELLARQLAQKLGIRYANLARRNRYTRSQTLLSKEDREVNLKNAFSLRSKDLSGSHILLVDDVFTTGATANHLSRLFKEHQAASVSILTAARAV